MEGRIPLKLVGVRSVALCICSHEQTQYNRVCCFLIFLRHSFFKIILGSCLVQIGLGMPPQATLAVFFSPVADILYFPNQWKSGNISTQECAGCKVRKRAQFDLGSVCKQRDRFTMSDRLPWKPCNSIIPCNPNGLFLATLFFAFRLFH